MNSPQSVASVKWDIVEDVASPVQSRGSRLRGQVAKMTTSAMVAVLTLGFIGGSPAGVNWVNSALGATTVASAFAFGQGLPLKNQMGEKRIPVTEGPDTHVGLSARRLAAAFSGYFQPAEPEVEYSTEYSFF
jgi:hypothetical protein